MSHHIYKEQADGEKDLKIFSSMHMNEDAVLFLVTAPHNGMEITKVQPVGTDRVVAIGINGKLFTPK